MNVSTFSFLCLVRVCIPCTCSRQFFLTFDELAVESAALPCDALFDQHTCDLSKHKCVRMHFSLVSLGAYCYSIATNHKSAMRAYFEHLLLCLLYLYWVSGTRANGIQVPIRNGVALLLPGFESDQSKREENCQKQMRANRRSCSATVSK